MAEVIINCFSCGQTISVTGLVGRRDECLNCGADLHVCKNCAHFDATAYNECREPSAETVREKEKSNFCGWFVPGATSLNPSDAKNTAVAAAEALFRKK
jgi:ribosome-binding protein aMBF1 (putative translation factor)